MAVFTPVTLDDMRQWITQFPLGQASALKGIASGIENSNFFLTTQRDGHNTDYVLTIFENLSFAQLPFYLHLMRHLAERGVLVPAPVPTHDGALFAALHGKPAAIVSKLEGSSQMDPQPVHCAAVGAMLARMHLAAQDFPLQQPNLRGLAWWQQTAPQVLPFLDAGNAALLRAYHLHRPMSPAELRALPGMRRAAALRFWLSRLADWHLPREAALLKPKDPTHFERVLADCLDTPCHPEL